MVDRSLYRFLSTETLKDTAELMNLRKPNEFDGDIERIIPLLRGTTNFTQTSSHYQRKMGKRTPLARRPEQSDLIWICRGHDLRCRKRYSGH